MIENAFFKLTDHKVDSIGSFELLPSWWSRFYEYPWAMRFARPGDEVADMGCGWHFRPLKNALAQVVDAVYAIDAHDGVLELEVPSNVSLVQADFTHRIQPLKDRSLDRVFCISVLEDLEAGDMIYPALLEFSRLVRDDGKIVCTFDTPFDETKPTPHYPGLNLDRFIRTAADAGLRFEGEIDTDKANAVVHSDYNLAVFHAVLTL